MIKEDIDLMREKSYSANIRDITTIQIRKITYNRLKGVGKFGDSMDDVVNRLLDSWYENNNNINKDQGSRKKK